MKLTICSDFDLGKKEFVTSILGGGGEECEPGRGRTLAESVYRAINHLGETRKGRYRENQEKSWKKDEAILREEARDNKKKMEKATTDIPYDFERSHLPGLLRYRRQINGESLRVMAEENNTSSSTVRKEVNNARERVMLHLGYQCSEREAEILERRYRKEEPRVGSKDRPNAFISKAIDDYEAYLRREERK